jgi:hypothetical protein
MLSSRLGRPHIDRMAMPKTPLERAFDLARTGDYSGVAEIRKQLKSEGFDLRTIEGPSLIRQLKGICVAAKQHGGQ